MATGRLAYAIRKMHLHDQPDQFGLAELLLTLQEIFRKQLQPYLFYFIINNSICAFSA